MTELRGARVLIAGAGYVGMRLAERLGTAGAEVFALRRNTRELPASMHPIAADLLDPTQLLRLPDTLDFVVYSASPDHHDEAAYERTYCRGLDNLLVALRRVSSVRVLFTSSTAVYGQTDGSWVDETSETRPMTFSGRRLLEAESLLRRSGRPHTIVRLGGIYGPGRQRLLTRALAGEARYPIEPTFTNRIHREDSAGALMHLMGLSEPAALYVGVDHEPAELKTVLTFICDKTNSPAPKASAQAQGWRGGNKRCSSLYLRQSGYEFRFPTFREGYADLIAASGS